MPSTLLSSSLDMLKLWPGQAYYIAMHFAEQAAMPPECGQQQPDAPLQGCLDMQAASQDASLLLDATTLHGMLQQPPLESNTVLEPGQQITSNLPASRPGSADSHDEFRNRKQQSRPTSAAAPSLAACLVPQTATAAEAQLGSGLEQGLALPCRPETLPTHQAVGAPLPVHASVALLDTANRGELCIETSVAAGQACASSRSLKADILAEVDSVLSSNCLPAAAAISSGGHVDLAGTAQAASEGAPLLAGAMCIEARLRALLQGGGLQELAALLSLEDSEIGSDFSDDSGSPSGNGTSGDGSGRGAAHRSEQASSYVEQEQVAGQSQVQSQLDINFLTVGRGLGMLLSLLTALCFLHKDTISSWSHRNLLASALTW